jgi:hypothetical protein
MQVIETAQQAKEYAMDVLPYCIGSLVFIFATSFLYMSWKLKKMSKRRGGNE